MDTDNLSTETYEATITTAAKFHEDLRLQFGLLASSCKDDDHYLKQSKELIKGLLEMPENYYDNIFFSTPPQKENLHVVLFTILKNIANVEKIPQNARHFAF